MHRKPIVLVLFAILLLSLSSFILQDSFAATIAKKPSNLQINGDPTTTSFTLSWGKNGTENIAGYKIYRASPVLGQFNTFGQFTLQLTNTTNIDGNTVTYRNSSLSPGQHFKWSVIAFNSTGSSTNATTTGGTKFAEGGTNFGDNVQNFQQGQTFGSNAEFASGQTFSGTMTFGSNTNFASGTIFATGQSFSGAQDFADSSLKFGSNTAFNTAQTFGSSVNFTGAQTFNGQNIFGSGAKFGDGQTFSAAQTFGANTNFTGQTDFASGQQFTEGAEFADCGGTGDCQKFQSDETYDFTAASIKFGNGTSFGAPRTFGSSVNFTGAQTFVGYNTFGSGAKFGSGQSFNVKQNFPPLAVFTGITDFVTNQFFGAGTTFATGQTFPSNEVYSFTNSSMQFGSGTSFGTARTFGDGANFTGAQTFVNTNIFKLGTEFGAGQIFPEDKPQNFSKYMRFGPNTSFGAKQTFYTGSVFDTGSSFIANQPMPANVVLPSGLLLSSITCPDSTCTPTAAQVLSEGELVPPGTDPDPVSGYVSSTDKTVSMPGIGFSMTFDTVTTAGKVSADMMDPSLVSGATSDGTGKLSMISSTGNTLNSLGPIMDISLNATDGTTVSGTKTITLSYDESNLGSTSESSLKMIHYTGGAWVTEENCSINTAANEITCTVASLSPFGIGTSPSSGGSSGSTAPPTLGGTAFSSNEYGITINQNGFPISQYTNTIPTQTVKKGVPTTFALLLYDDSGSSTVTHAEIALNQINDRYQDSKTRIEWDKTGNKVTEIDPNGLISAVMVSTKSVGNKMQVEFQVTFEKPVPKSNMIIRSWDEKRNSIDTTIMSAIEVTSDQTQSQQTLVEIPEQKPVSAVPTEAQTTPDAQGQGMVVLKQWAGYDVQVASDKQLLSSLSVSEDKLDTKIPQWAKKSIGSWAATQEITYKEFSEAIKYLINLK